MDELHILHDAITNLWMLIKKYSNKITDQETYDRFCAEAEAYHTNDQEVNDLFQQWVVKFLNYEGQKQG